MPRERWKHSGWATNTLRGINPKLVMVAITPFGQKGPYKDYKAYNINCCGTGGMSTGVGDPKREPLTMPFSQGGYQAGGNRRYRESWLLCWRAARPAAANTSMFPRPRSGLRPTPARMS
jgi:hypothetical protein